MRIDQQPAYLLHARPYRETSLLLDIFSRDHGRVGLIARGIRSTRRHAQRALLQPGRPLLLGWRDVGELPLLATVDAGESIPRIIGDGLLSLLYVNELLLRLLPRREGQGELFARYAWLLSLLGESGQRAEALRRFEAALLAACGDALTLEAASDGQPLDPDQRYRYLPGEGLLRLPATAVARQADVIGEAVMALRDDSPLRADWLPSLRQLMRACISAQLNGRPLQSWRLSAMLSPVRAESASDAEE